MVSVLVINIKEEVEATTGLLQSLGTGSDTRADSN